MKYLIIVAVLMLSGCESGMFDAKARFLCKDRGGVYYTYVWFQNSPFATCNDGSRVELSNVIITDPEYFAKEQ